MGVITSKQLVRYARGQLGRPYWYGTFGQRSSLTLYRQKKAQYPARYKDADTASYLKQADESIKVHDCAGLVKGAIFCSGVIDAAPKYNCNFDRSADGIIQLCEEKGQVWTVDKMPKNITGLVMWKPGHMGVWDAETQTTIEAKGHAWGVCETTSTPWQKAGRLPPTWVIYENTPAPAPTPAPDPQGDKIMITVEQLKKGSKGPEVFAVQSILKGKNYKGKDGKVLALDSSFGGNTEHAVKSFQAKSGLTSDGIVGAKTWDALINK